MSKEKRKNDEIDGACSAQEMTMSSRTGSSMYKTLAASLASTLLLAFFQFSPSHRGLYFPRSGMYDRLRMINHY